MRLTTDGTRQRATSAVNAVEKVRKSRAERSRVTNPAEGPNIFKFSAQDSSSAREER
jgi:hypothetical protein